MKILFFTDPHLGRGRSSNMTADSALRLQATLHNTATGLVDTYKPDGGLAICLGDLFDRHTNPEYVIQQGVELLNAADFVLAGNHDYTNRVHTISSFELLAALAPDKCFTPIWGKPDSYTLDVGNTRLAFVPHCAHQELFEQCVDDAISACRDSGRWNVLGLHCNYQIGREMQDTALNLTPELTTRCLSVFHTILLGHEHAPAEHHGGRVRIIGNTFPTSFADISDKRVLLYDTETGQFESVTTVRKDEVLWSGPASALTQALAAGRLQGHFLDVEDDLPPGEAFKLVGRVFKEQERVLALRLRVKDGEKKEKKLLEIDSVESLPQLVERDLAERHPNLLPLWKETYDAIVSQA